MGGTKRTMETQFELERVAKALLEEIGAIKVCPMHDTWSDTGAYDADSLNEKLGLFYARGDERVVGVEGLRAVCVQVMQEAPLELSCGCDRES